jgi:hypothetical protein
MVVIGEVAAAFELVWLMRKCYLGVFHGTDCAGLAHELGVTVLFVSELRESVDYDTEDDVHENNVDDDEACHVVEEADVVHVTRF